MRISELLLYWLIYDHKNTIRTVLIKRGCLGLSVLFYLLYTIELEKRAKINEYILEKRTK